MPLRRAGGGGRGTSDVRNFEDLENTPDEITSADVGKSAVVNSSADGLVFEEIESSKEFYHLGPTPNRFADETARDTHAQDRANEDDWLQEYIDDATKAIRVVDGSTINVQAEPTKTTTDDTVFDRTAIPDVRSSLGLQVSGGKYYVTFTGDAGPNDLKSVAEGKAATDRLILKDTSENEEANITGVAVARQRAQQSVWGESLTFNPGTGTATYTFPAQSVVSAISLFDEPDPADASRRVFRFRLTVGTGSTGQTNANTLNTLFDNIAASGNIPGASEVKPARITFTQGTGGNERSHDLELGLATTESNTIAGTTTHFVVVRVEGIHTNTAGAPASGTAINTGWDITANFLSNQYRTTFTLEGSDQSPFPALPGPSDWDIVDRNIAVVWKDIDGAGVGNTVYTDDSIDGDGSSASNALSVAVQLPDPSTGNDGDVVARNAAGTAYELVAQGSGGGGSGEDNIVYATATLTYTAAETAELAGKVVYAISDSDITLTFRDPGVTSDRGFVVVNMSGNNSSVTLDATPTSERDHVVVLQSTGDIGVAVWDESADKWEFVSAGAVLEISESESFGNVRTKLLRDRIVMCRHTSDITITLRNPGEKISFFLINASPNGSNVTLTTNSTNNRDRVLTSTEFGQTVTAVWDTTSTQWEWTGSWEFNENPEQVSSSERTDGTETEVRGFSPADIVSMIGTHESAGGGSSEVFFVEGDATWQPSVGDGRSWDGGVVIWTGAATTLTLPASLGGSDYEFLIENRGTGSITYDTTNVVRVGESMLVTWTGSTTSYSAVVFDDREGAEETVLKSGDPVRGSQLASYSLGSGANPASGEWVRASDTIATVDENDSDITNEWLNNDIWVGEERGSVTGLQTTGNRWTLTFTGITLPTSGNLVLYRDQELVSDEDIEDAVSDLRDGVATTRDTLKELSDAIDNIDVASGSDIIHDENGTRSITRDRSDSYDNKMLMWRGSADATWTFADMNADDNVHIIIRNIVSSTLSLVYGTPATTVELEQGDLIVLKWNGTTTSWSHDLIEAGGDAEESIEIVRATTTYTADQSAALSGKRLFVIATADATLTFTDPGGSTHIAFEVVNLTPFTASVNLRTASGTNNNGTLDLDAAGDSAAVVWDDTNNRYEFYGTGGEAANPVEIVRATKTYSAGESASLSGKILFCLGDAAITLSFNDPGGSLDLPFVVYNFSPSFNTVTLEGTSASLHREERVLHGVGDYATCVWDDSVSRWEFDAHSVQPAMRVNVTSDTTFDLETQWEQWRGRKVLFRTGVNLDPVITIRTNSGGTWSPPADDKGTAIEFHPLWSTGRIRLEQMKFARHNSDGRIEGFDASSTARDATKGHGEPFRLIYDDYYVLEEHQPSLTSELHPWHVAPLTQDVAGVLGDFDKTVAHKQELQAVEGKVDLLISSGNETLTLPYYATFNFPDSEGWQDYEYQLPTSTNTVKAEISKGEHKVFFRTYNASNEQIDEFDLLEAFKRIGIWDDQNEILDDEVAVYLSPTVASNAVTASSAAFVASASSGRLLAPFPQDLDITVTGRMLWAVAKHGTANPLVNRNRISSATTNARAANSLDLFGTDTDLAALRTLLTDEDGNVESNARIQLIDDSGDHQTLTPLTISSSSTTSLTFNSALARRTLTFAAPSADIVPDYNQSLRAFLEPVAVEEFAKVGSDTLIPANKFEATFGESSELFNANYNVRATMQLTDSTSPVTIPTEGSLWFSWVYEDENNQFSIPCKFLREDLDAMEVGDDPADGTDAEKEARQITHRFRLDTTWNLLTLGRDDSNRLLLGTTDTTTAGEDPSPLRIWHVPAGVTVDAIGDIAGVVIATDTFTIPATGDIDTSQLNFALDASAPSDYAVSSDRRNLHLGNKRRVTNQTGYLVQLLDSDENILSEVNFPLMQDANRKEGYLAATFGQERAVIEVVYDSSIGGSATDRANIWIDETPTARSSGGNAWTAREFTVVVRELVVPSASGTALQQSDSGGAFSTIQEQEFLRQAVSGTSVDLGGANGYGLNSEATHANVTITAPANFAQDAKLYYIYPGDDEEYPVYDENGDELTLTAGNSISHRFGSAFFDEVLNVNRLKLRIKSTSSTALSGDDLSIDLVHETDVNSANIESLELLTSTVTVSAQTPASNLTGATVTEVEFDKYVEFDNLDSLGVTFGTFTTSDSENADAELRLIRDAMERVGNWRSTDALPASTDIRGWFSLGWINVGSAQDPTSWRKNFSAAWAWYYLSQSAHSSYPARIIAFIQEGAYVTGLQVAAFREQCQIRHVSCMRKI